MDTMNRQAKEYNRNEMNREASGEPVRSQNTRTVKVRAEIEEDLKGLQNNYNQIVTTLQSRGEVIGEFARESALFIKKYAARLKVNLSLPEPDRNKKIKAEAPSEDLRKSLITLCKHIYEFITNPIFETKVGLNVEHSTKAGQSLEMIIHLAGAIAGVD